MSTLNEIWIFGGYLLPFIFVISLVVFVHEFGHFIVGRCCGVHVETFSVGFGRELCHFIDNRGTRWRIALWPIGGYVKFHGQSASAARCDAEASGSMPAEKQSVSFNTQPVSIRAAIILAGPAANFLLAILLFTGGFYVDGRMIVKPVVAGVEAGGAAEGAGLRAGDLILSIDGRAVESFEDVQRAVQPASDQALRFTVRRDGGAIDLVATPRQRDVSSGFGTTRVGAVGIKASSKAEDIYVKTYSLGQSAVLAVSETWFVVSRTGSYLTALVSGHKSGTELSGPISIAAMSGETAKIGFGALLTFAAFISISVGFMNLLPVPILDGGYLFYYIIEVVRGRALTEKTQQLGFRIGLTFLGGLMILQTCNDLVRVTLDYMKS
jgi:regulator of sigma E protease